MDSMIVLQPTRLLKEGVSLAFALVGGRGSRASAVSATDAADTPEHHDWLMRTSRLAWHVNYPATWSLAGVRYGRPLNCVNVTGNFVKRGACQTR